MPGERLDSEYRALFRAAFHLANMHLPDGGEFGEDAAIVLSVLKVRHPDYVKIWEGHGQ